MVPPPREGCGGQSPRNITFLFAPILMTFFLHTFQVILKKINPKNVVEKLYGLFFHRIYFIVFLESSETCADPSLNEIGAKLNFSSKCFLEKSLGT